MKPLQMEKKQRIEACAMRLFMEKGIDETSVNDIVREVHLAKGTFYTYFKDKAALINEIIIKKNIYIINALIESARAQSLREHTSWGAAFLRNLITYYKDNPCILRLLQRSFRFEECRELILMEIQQGIHHFSEFLEEFHHENESERDALNRFLLLMEITGIVCHNAMFYHQPDDITHIEEFLYQNLCASFANKEGGST